MKAKLFLVITTFLMMITLANVSYEEIETPISYENPETAIFSESGFSFVRRVIQEDAVIYDVCINGAKHLEKDLNELSTNLYLNWREMGKEYKIYMVVVNQNNHEEVLEIMLNGEWM